MADTPRVWIIVLNWNGAEDTVALIESLRNLEGPTPRLLIVDNGSRHGSLERIRAALRPGEAEILETGENLGYAGGNNAGLRHALDAGADYCLVLNNDLTVAPDLLTRLLREAQREPRLAVLGPRVYRHDQPETLFYPGWKIDWRRWLFHRVPTPQAQQQLIPVDWVQGCALLLRAEFLRAQGLFDENYHLYCEDADLCVRARRAGWLCAELHGARVWHRGYGSAGAASPLKTYYALRNRSYFIAKLAPRANRPLLYAQLLGYETGPKILREAARAVASRRRPAARRQLRALLAALRDAALRRYGRGPDWLFRDLGESAGDLS